MEPRILLLALLLLVSMFSLPAHGQFRRGLFSESTEITLHPHGLPAILLPAGSVQLEIRNASGALSKGRKS